MFYSIKKELLNFFYFDVLGELKRNISADLDRHVVENRQSRNQMPLRLSSRSHLSVIREYLPEQYQRKQIFIEFRDENVFLQDLTVEINFPCDMTSLK